MDLLADVVRNPAFAPEEIDRQKQQAISSLQVSANDPDYIASSVFDRLVYGFHPYGLPGSGTAETLAGITREDLQAFHKALLRPQQHDPGGRRRHHDRRGVRRRCERVFGAWPRGDADRCRSRSSRRRRRGASIVVDKPDAVQTEIRVGQLAIPRKHKDYLAWDLAVQILGGEGANRLHRVLRSERGLTYGASGRDAGDEAGRRLRGRDRHAHRDDRRGAAADGGRVREVCSGSASSSASWATRRRSWPAASR